VTFDNKDPGRGAQMLQGMVMDGREVALLTISLKVRAAEIKSDEGNEQPALLLQFYDAERRPMNVERIGPFEGSFEWKKFSKAIHVPPRAREAIVRVGLNGATGQLSVDDIRLSSQPRQAPAPAAAKQRNRG